MSRQKPHHTKQFKLDAVSYRKEHPDLTQKLFLCQYLSTQFTA